MNLVYLSKAWKGSLGQDYSVFSDRIELRFRLLLKTYKIPMAHVTRIRVVEGGFEQIRAVFRDEASLMSIIWVLVLDTAAFRRHVLLETSTGTLRYFRFTPVNHDEFVAAVNAILKGTRSVT
jgi:hypothetical protein